MVSSSELKKADLQTIIGYLHNAATKRTIFSDGELSGAFMARMRAATQPIITWSLRSIWEWLRGRSNDWRVTSPAELHDPQSCFNLVSAVLESIVIDGKNRSISYASLYELTRMFAPDKYVFNHEQTSILALLIQKLNVKPQEYDAVLALFGTNSHGPDYQTQWYMALRTAAQLIAPHIEETEVQAIADNHSRLPDSKVVAKSVPPSKTELGQHPDLDEKSAVMAQSAPPVIGTTAELLDTFGPIDMNGNAIEQPVPEAQAKEAAQPSPDNNSTPLVIDDNDSDEGLSKSTDEYYRHVLGRRNPHSI